MWSWQTNAEAFAFPPDLVALFRGAPALRRQKDMLEDQFRYRYTVSEEGGHGMYLARFRQAFNIVGIVAFDKFFLMKNKPPEAVILEPLPP